jgi:hypothetical protein
LKGKIEKTGSWFTYKTKKIGTLHLSAGTLDFVLGAGSEKEKGPLFDLREVRLISVK